MALGCLALAIAAVLLVPGLTGPVHAENATSAKVEALEAEVAALKAKVAELESLLRARPTLGPDGESVAPLADGEQDLSARVSALETQIGALTDQVERMGQTPVGEAPAAAPPEPEKKTSAWQPDVIEALKSPEPEAAPEALAPDSPAPESQEAAAPETAPAPPPQQAENVDPRARWYGPRPEDADDGTPKSILPPQATGALPEDAPQTVAALPSEDAQALYEQGYGDYLQRDYAAAEESFTKLVKEHPNDPLAGSAQYWAGETYYVRKQYKKAADTFLAGYRKYSSGEKAPDTLLKLGMSLAALGQKDAACSTFKELGKKFPEAPEHLRSQADGEAGKAGCTP